MTNEEAAKILRRIQEPEAWEPQINGAAFEALDMAIEALGRQQAAGSKDMISRSSLLAKYDEQHEGPPGRARKLIEDEPPVLGTNLAEVGTDAISRQKAIDALTEYGNGRAVFISVGEAVIRIEQLPSAEPKRGKWVDDGDPLMLTCGNCGYGVMRYNNTPFCPNCGAKMEK